MEVNRILRPVESIFHCVEGIVQQVAGFSIRSFHPFMNISTGFFSFIGRDISSSGAWEFEHTLLLLIWEIHISFHTVIFHHLIRFFLKVRPFFRLRGVILSR